MPTSEQISQREFFQMQMDHVRADIAEVKKMLTQLMQEMATRAEVETLDDRVKDIEGIITLVKWAFGIISAVIVGLILYLIQIHLVP